MKKILSIGLSVLITASAMISAMPLSAAAQTDYYEEEGVHYKLCDDNKATIVGCDDQVDLIYIYSKLENGYTVTSIADGAFQGNMDLTSVTINQQLESVGDYAFESCSHLFSVKFANSVKHIGVGAFSMCPSLEFVSLGSNAKEIDKGAFFFDTKLRAFSCPKQLESIGDYAFAFSGVTTVIMNNKLKTIPDRLFYGCDMLQSVKLPKNLESIGNYSFAECEQLDVDEFPETLDSIGDCAFKDCGITDVEFYGSKIGEYAFSENGTMETVSFTDNLKEVKPLAFSGTIVKKIQLPNNADYENGAFAGIKTANYELSEANENYTVQDGVVYTKDMKTLVYYPAGVYDSELYYGDSENIQTVEYTVPDGVETISPYAFYLSHYVSEVKLPDTLKEIGANAFEKSSSLKKITIPSGVKTIHASTFSECSSLEEANLGSVETIEDYAFLNCFYSFDDDKAVTVNIPDALIEFSPMAFLGANVSLKANGNFKDINGSLCTADGKKLIFYPASANTSYTIPDGVEEIGYRAFSSNRYTTEIFIPNSLKKIDEEALEYSIMFMYGYENKYFTDGLHLIGNASKGVKAYADDHNIGVFSSQPSQNIESVTLKGKETAEFIIYGANTADIVYTSGNDRICSVSDDGIITGLSKGTTYVTAAVGTSYFKCKVKVTSESGIKYTGFDDSNYYAVTQKTYEGWKNHYIENNAGLVSKYTEGIDEAAISAYQGNTYYRAMNGATDYSGDNHASGEVQFGKGYEDMIRMINHACVTELKRYNNPDSMVLYSGAKPYASRLIAGEVNTLKNLKAAIGKTFKHNQFISTTLDPMIADGFYSRGEGVVLIIYAEKTALDNLPSALIAALHSQFTEYEQLFACGAEFEVIDAGVRWYNVEIADDDFGGYQRYVKLKLLGGTKEPEKLPTPSIKLSKNSANLYVKKSTSVSYSLKNCYDGEVTFKSSNSKVAKVSKTGKITALKKGTATITVSNSEASAKIKITVKNPTLNKTKLSLKKGKSFTLKISGKVGTPKFTSSKKKIASVSQKGVIKAKSKGTTVISVNTNGITLKCKVTVK